MKFELIIEDLLNELSGTEIYNKYYSKIPYDEFKSIVDSDPQTTIGGDGVIARLGKYAKLLLNMYQKGGLRLEDLEKAKEYLGYVYSHKIPVEINKINELGDLYNVVKDYIVKDTKSLSEILKVLSQEEFKVLHNGEGWYIFQPLTEKAACYLGVNTEWCTTWGPYSLNKKNKDRGNLYQRYAKDGPLFIMINKSDQNDKYQFHFESKQFMDKDDRRIDTSNFFKNKIELRNFFFPSFLGEVSNDELQLELKRIDVLPEEDGAMLIKKSVGQIDNPLVNAILNEDEVALEQLIISDELNGSVEISGGRLVIPVSDLKEDTQSLYDVISYYEYESENGWQYVYDDMRDRGIDEYEEEQLLKFFSDYYEANSSELGSSLGIRNFEQFQKMFFDNYKSNDNIQEDFWTDIADLSYGNYETANESELNEFKNLIEFEYGFEILMSVVSVVKFLIRKNIKGINDENGISLWDFMDGYISSNNLPTEYERIYDFSIVYPKYGENNSLTKRTNELFDQYMDDSESTHHCAKLRQTLNDVMNKFFKNSTTFENEHIQVRLKSTEIDCVNGTVKVEYTNKDTGETYGGWRSNNDTVKVENLASLVTNYKLFENLIKFKRNI
jgi:hypothetical protein